MSERTKPAEFKIIQSVKAVLADTTLNPSECRVLAHLMLSAGEAGETLWGHNKLADTLGLSRSQSIRIISKLHLEGRLRSQRRGLKRVNRYLLPWHSEFSEVAPMRLQERPEVAPERLPEVAPMALQEVARMELQEVAPMRLPIGKDFSVKDTSSSSSVSPEVLRRSEEDDAVLLKSKHQNQTRTAEELNEFAGWMFQEMRLITFDQPREGLVRETMNQAPDWSVAQIIRAYKVNSDEKPGKPKAYVWFKIVLADIYKRWEGKPPELQQPQEKNNMHNNMKWDCCACKDTGRRWFNDEPCVCYRGNEFRNRHTCVHCKDTGIFPVGSSCRHECPAGIAQREKARLAKESNEAAMAVSA